MQCLIHFIVRHVVVAAVAEAGAEEDLLVEDLEVVGEVVGENKLPG